MADVHHAQPALSDDDIRTAAQWREIRTALRCEFGAGKFDAFLTQLELVSVRDDTVSLSAPTQHLKSWATAHYRDRLLAAWRGHDAGIVRVVITVRAIEQPLRRPTKLLAVPAAPPPAPPPQRPGSFDPALQLDKLVIYRGNHMAQAAVHHAVYETTTGLRHEFNPIFIHGGHGLGKTHLLRGAVQAAAAAGRRALHMACGNLYYDAAALKSIADDMARCDLVAIDDVHAIVSRPAQALLRQAIDRAIKAGCQVVLAAPVAPAELDFAADLAARIGLAVPIGYPDLMARAAILQALITAKAARGHGRFVQLLSPDVLAVIAGMDAGDGRALAAVLDRLHAGWLADGVTPQVARACGEVEAAAARFDMSALRVEEMPRVEEIQRAVARHYNIGRLDLLSSRRTKDLVWPRQIAMYLAKTLTLRTLPDIGRRFNRDHTTVLHAIRKIADSVAADTAVAAEVDAVKAELRAR